MSSDAAKKEIPVLDLIEAYSSSPMARVNAILISGGFAPAPEEIIGEKETVIGELTSFEKAIFTARNIVADELNSIADANNSMVDDAKKNGVKADLAKVKENKRLAGQYAKEAQLFGDLLWASIRHRLGAPAYECDGIGIRDGYKIVQFANNEDGAISKVIGGAMLFGSEGHNCDGCDSYDECDLFLKQFVGKFPHGAEPAQI